MQVSIPYDTKRMCGEHTGAGVSTEDLDAGAILRIEHRDVFHEHICDDVHLASVLRERP